MDFGDTKPTLLSLLGGPAPMPGAGNNTGNGQSETVMREQAERAAAREDALNRYFPPTPPVDNTAMLPLLQILAHGAVPALPVGMVQMPPPEQPMTDDPNQQQPVPQGAV